MPITFLLLLALSLTPMPAETEIVASDAPGTVAPGGDASRPQVLVLSLEAQRVDPQLAAVLDGLITQRVSEVPSLDVVTTKDLQQLANLESQRLQTGCDTASCLAEIAGALGARYVIYGSVGRLGELLVVQLNLFDSAAGKAVARADARAEGEAQLAEGVPAAVDKIVAPLNGEAATTAQPVDPSAVAEAPAAEGGGVLGWTVLGAGAVVLAAGGLAALAAAVLAGGSELALADTSGAVGGEAKSTVLLAGRVGLVVAGGALVVAAAGGALIVTGVFLE